MKFLVLSRTKAKEFSYKENTVPYIMISITDITLENVAFNRDEQLKALLRLKFDDTDVQCANAISKDDAKRIVDFVEKWKEIVELIVVHCEAGVSHSAGVCAALMKWLNGDDTPIFGNAYYKPNMRCYRVVLNELMMRDEKAENL